MTRKSYDAGQYGTSVLGDIIGSGKFTFPKSVYAVMDTLKYFIANKKNALVVDFFAGSGTTMHAVNLLNSIDNGHRRCIMVTNNEVSADEAKALDEKGYRPGDKEWDRRGIARYVTWPRTVCSIKGCNIDGKPLDGNYGCNVEQYTEIDGETVNPETGKKIRGKVYKKEKEPAYPELADLKMSDGFKTNDYLKSLYRMAHLLSMSKLHREAIREVQDEIVQIIRDYVEDLKATGKYDDLVRQVKQFKLATQIFDAFGETVDNYSVHDMFTTTDTDIERQFQIADVKLGREGIGMAYGNKYGDLSDLTAFKIDVILFVADENCMNRLHTYAENRFHGLNDDYRRYIATISSEKIRRDYDSIVSDGDVVSKHNFRLPETIQVPHEAGGKEYRDHLFVSDATGTAKLKLNGWEADLIAEEEKRKDFVCWIRNPSRASWALCIPYEINGEIKPTYPDFIIVREDERLGYVIDILEPHSADFKDNLGKAKGFAEYARQNPGVGRIQLIRMGKDAAGRNQFRRLDMYKTAIREKVSCAINTDELDHIFDTDGVIE